MNALALVPLAAAALAATASVPSSPQPDSAACRTAIREVRESAGLPALDRGNAHPGQALLIAAVDKRIDRCRVLVMAHDTRDIRPEPAPSDNRALLIPAR
jgi:hypothetical protein